jgi:hypothetical protein
MNRDSRFHLRAVPNRVERVRFLPAPAPGRGGRGRLETGKDLWGGRRLSAAFWASLVHADGKIYATDQEGDTYVFAAKPQFEQLGRNRLGEHSNASLAVSDGEIFLRTHEHPWCIGGAKK